MIAPRWILNPVQPIAVPAVLLFNHFNRRMNIMLTVAENHSHSLRIALVEATGTGSAEASAMPSSPARGNDSPAGQVETPARETVGSLAG